MQTTNQSQYLLTEEHVELGFPPGTAAKGRAIYKRGNVLTSSLSVNAQVISGRVLGKRADIFEATVFLRWREDKVDILSQCTCEEDLYCVHGVALLYQALDLHPDGLPYPVEQFAGNSAFPEVMRSVKDLIEQEALTQHNHTCRHQQAPKKLDGKRVELPEDIDRWIRLASANFELEDDHYYSENDTRPLYFFFPAVNRMRDGAEELDIKIVTAKKLKDGQFGRLKPECMSSLAICKVDGASREEIAAARLFIASTVGSTVNKGYPTSFPEEPEIIEPVITKLLQTGRCYWQDVHGEPLHLGTARQGRLEWRSVGDMQAPHVVFDKETTRVLWNAMPWYVDTVSNEVGPVVLAVSRTAARLFLEIPPIKNKHAALFGARLTAVFPDLGLPTPPTEKHSAVIKSKPKPFLRLIGGSSRSDGPNDLALALIEFQYENFDHREVGQQYCLEKSGKVTVYLKDVDKEYDCFDQLYDMGFDEVAVTNHPDVIAFGLKKNSSVAWFSFIAVDVPKLKQEGWTVTIDGAFPYEVVRPDGDIKASINPQRDSSWWFEIELGIDVNKKRISLLPILMSVLRATEYGADNWVKSVEHFCVKDTFYLPLSDGKHLSLPADRVRSVVRALLEFLDRDKVTDGGEHAVVGLPGLLNMFGDAPELIKNSTGAVAHVAKLAQRVKGFEGLRKVPPPSGLKAQLRDYQLDGLSWLQFIAEFNLGGILADDMGLGKTVQTLAHIQTEKESGRLGLPCLVVCPTSVIPNWINEAARFTPTLRVVRLHGSNRNELLDAIEGADLVVTSYPLLVRDAKHLTKQNWHAVILDEAQAIKNHRTAQAKVVCQLKANHRLCLTGTPVENHLEELWSQFNFLMPSCLGDTKTFAKVFRTPIEKGGDTERLKVLSKRLKPFMLRRTKDLVASELPPKTIMIKDIELEGDQRDLYETIRSAMQEKVQTEVAKRGVNASQIIILDALLKLRQACCDPRLVPLNEARTVQSSAKLDYLMEMLRNLCDTGRRTILFSSFTSMLDLIAEECTKAGIKFVQLRGDTKDREAPVVKFQSGDVPLFLISLKAGGTGLNLTAADTVIHYDPWWNPAAEDQATDRAHRIGQDKHVFVYKFIAQGTVESRMLELQNSKRILAEGIFSENTSGGGSGFGEADLELLFSPIGASQR